MVPLSSVLSLLGGRPSARWVLKIKHDGSYKTRWVARGFSQHEGIDHLDTYTPVLHLENLFLLAYTILMGYKIHSNDVNNTFLQALLNMEHHEYVCPLTRALHGLKQALSLQQST